MTNITSSHHSNPDVLVTPAKNYDMLGLSYLMNEYNSFMNRTVGYNWTKALFAFLIWFLMFSLAPSIIITILQGYMKEFIYSIYLLYPRTKDWFLVDNPLPLICILVSYLLFCTKYGPQLMKNRKPFKLTNILLAYNVVQVVVSAIILHEGLMGGWLFHYNFKCQPVDYSDNPVAKRMARAVWYYYMCKLIELLDTVFFVLRKKDNQVSFLHLYHHSIMPLCAWIGVKWLPGGHGTLLGVINSFIHIIMYSYYLLAALGPQYQKYLWWKKYLTAMQIIQFIIIIGHSAQLFIYECNYPKTMIALLGINTIFIMALFTAFYINSYVKKTK